MLIRSRRLVVSLLLAWPMALFAVSINAATYYVDQTNGQDSNSGTSPSAAWKNAPGMSAYSGSGRLSPGDTVLFDSADTWSVNGTQGIYLVGGVTYIGNDWGNGTRATLRASANIDSAVVRFRDHPSEPTVFEGFEVDANSKVTNGIEMNHSFYAGPLTGATKRIDDVVVHHIWSRTSQGTFKYGIIVSNHGGRDGEVANVEILNSVIHDTSRDALPIYPGDSNKDCLVRNVLVRGNTVFNTGQDPDYQAGAGIIVKGRVIDAVVESNYVHSTQGAGIFINGNESNHFGTGPENIHIRHNIVNTNTIHGSIRLYDGSSGKDPKDVKIYGNIVYNNTRGAGFLIDRDLGSTNSVRLFNNTFFNAPVIINNTAANFPVLEIRNNIFHYADGVPLTENGKLTGHSNNLFFGNGTLVRSGGSNFSSSNLGNYESSAIAADPQFVDSSRLPAGFAANGNSLIPKTDGLSLKSSSPAIDRGAGLGGSYNTSINSVDRPAGNSWDIGAYETGGAVASPPKAPTNIRVQ